MTDPARQAISVALGIAEDNARVYERQPEPWPGYVDELEEHIADLRRGLEMLTTTRPTVLTEDERRAIIEVLK